jgi:hypothetical protein
MNVQWFCNKAHTMATKRVAKIEIIVYPVMTTTHNGNQKSGQNRNNSIPGNDNNKYVYMN